MCSKIVGVLKLQVGNHIHNFFESKCDENTLFQTRRFPIYCSNRLFMSNSSVSEYPLTSFPIEQSSTRR